MPNMNNYRALIMALRMWAVPLDNVIFETYEGEIIGKGGSVLDVVQATNTRKALNENREASLVANQNAFNRMPPPNPTQLAKQHDPRSDWGNRPKMPDVAPPAIRHF